MRAFQETELKGLRQREKSDSVSVQIAALSW